MNVSINYLYLEMRKITIIRIFSFSVTCTPVLIRRSLLKEGYI